MFYGGCHKESKQNWELDFCSPGFTMLKKMHGMKGGTVAIAASVRLLGGRLGASVVPVAAARGLASGSTRPIVPMGMSMSMVNVAIGRSVGCNVHFLPHSGRSPCAPHRRPTPHLP